MSAPFSLSSGSTDFAFTAEKNTGNVIGGLKAAINNPRVSEEAKEHDRERLREMGEEVGGAGMYLLTVC